MKKLITISLNIFFIFFISTESYSQSHELSDQYYQKAVNLTKQGRYLEAAQMYEKSAEVEKKSQKPRLSHLAVKLGWAGYSYRVLGQFDRALKYYEEALSINRRLGREDKVATYLNNIGTVCGDWGQFDKALKYHEEALTINRRLGRETEVAACLNNIGLIYKNRGKYEKSIKYYEEALTINKKLDRQTYVAIDLNNIGAAYKDLLQYDKAINCIKESLAIGRKLGRQNIVSANLNNIGLIHVNNGQYNEAIKYFKESLAILKRLGMKPQVALTSKFIGVSYHKSKKYNEAIRYLKESVNLIENLRKTAAGNARRDYLASQINSYQWLSYTYVKNKDLNSAFATIELSRAKLLAERIARSESQIIISSVKKVQKELSGNTAVLIYTNEPGSSNPIAQIVITDRNIYGTLLPYREFMDLALKKYETAVKNTLENQRGISIAQKSEQQKKRRDKGKINFEDIINYYRSILADPSSQYSRGTETATKSETFDEDDPQNLERLLYGFLIKPVAKHIEDKKRLIIVPEGILCFLPFETLIDENNDYLAETYHVSYAQSMGVLNLIKKREYKTNRKPLLAFGGAVYDDISYSAEMIQNEKQLVSFKKNIYASFENKRSVRNAYAALDIANWSNLPGTLAEVENIATAVSGAKIYTGSKVTENHIKKLSSMGELTKYKVIHFATHGLVVPAVPELSAIVLSQFKKERGGEDGYLRMQEIADLNIKADFINLSACETGLGKIYGGEGVVGLTQSFLIAGANGLSVSLWQVADISTSQFMTEMYKLVEQQGAGYDEAITEIKRSFIKGDFGEAYRVPYYWAPFVYYGK